VRILLAILLSALGALGATTNQIVHRGVTFQFDSSVEFGQYVNGDYYVVGPVTVTNMLPAWSGNDNGWQINAPYYGFQGLDSDVNGYDAALRVAMPFTIATNACIVKAIANTNQTLPAIKTIAILTVVTSAPPAGGSVTFRPPYSGTTNRPHYTVSDLQTNLLPAYLRSGLTNSPTLAETVDDYDNGVLFEFHTYDARRFRPLDTLADYQPENGPLYSDGILNLFLDDTWAQKSNAVVLVCQAALDRAFVVHQGYQQPGTGHNPMHRTIAAFGATMFNITPILSYLGTNDGFHEDEFLYRSTSNNVVLWGQTASTESQYWGWITSRSGSRSYKDPYQLIDGGNYLFGAGEYQIITAQSLKGAALICRLMPSLQACFPTNRWANLNEFAERWVNYGGRMSPDDAAPYDGVAANYGVTFGPDGSGGYIKGAGRNPSGGYTPDGGQYRSLFVANMWQVYASTPVVPQLSTVAVSANGTTWTINYSEAVTIGAGGSGGNAASLSLGSVTLTYVSGSGTSAITFTGSRTVYAGETGTLNYSQPGDGWQDADGDDVVTVTGVPVTNNSTQTAPTTATARGLLKYRGLKVQP